MANSLNYKIGIDNIFDFSFMDDFTTVILAKEEYNIDISTLNYQNEDDFYSFIENKVYSEKDLFKILPPSIKTSKINGHGLNLTSADIIFTTS
mgnify:CR=1 FL=1